MTRIRMMKMMGLLCMILINLDTYRDCSCTLTVQQHKVPNKCALPGVKNNHSVLVINILE